MKTQRMNPSELPATALSQEGLDARVAAALPWVDLRNAKADSWLEENARKFNLQSRLGFVVTLARRLAENQNNPRLSELGQLEEALEKSRLVKEDYLPCAPHTDTEKEWSRGNRTEDAAHWNLLTRMRPEHLAAVEVLEINSGTTKHYAAIGLALKRKGKPIPTNDLWVAALCLQHALPLLSRDRHFDLISGIKRIEW
jgi:predicted nucleic acid-binding protein